MATEQQIENRKLWVEALRSDKYAQGKGKLRAGDSFCCLGVLCDLAGEKWTPTETYEGPAFATSETDEIYDASKKAMEFVGLKDATGGYDVDVEDEGYDTTLADQNDRGKTFAEIADIIESNPAGLFID